MGFVQNVHNTSGPICIWTDNKCFKCIVVPSGIMAIIARPTSTIKNQPLVADEQVEFEQVTSRGSQIQEIY